MLRGTGASPKHLSPPAPPGLWCTAGLTPPKQVCQPVGLVCGKPIRAAAAAKAQRLVAGLHSAAARQVGQLQPAHPVKSPAALARLHPALNGGCGGNVAAGRPHLAGRPVNGYSGTVAREPALQLAAAFRFEPVVGYPYGYQQLRHPPTPGVIYIY